MGQVTKSQGPGLAMYINQVFSRLRAYRGLLLGKLLAAPSLKARDALGCWPTLSVAMSNWPMGSDTVRLWRDYFVLTLHHCKVRLRGRQTS